MSGWQNRQAVYALALNMTQQAVLLALVEHMDKYGRNAFPGVARLAWIARCSVRTVQRVLSQLIKEKIIAARTERVGGRGMRTVYDLTLDQVAPEKWREEYTGPKPRQGDAVLPEETPTIEEIKGDFEDVNPVICALNPVNNDALLDLPKDLNTKLPKSACESEPSGEARQRLLETPETEVTSSHLGESVVNELDVAYEAIPEPERETWLEKARRALTAEGWPEFALIKPTLMEHALRLWVGSTVPGFASG